MMIKWWPLFGIKNKLTEKHSFKMPASFSDGVSNIFRRSLHVYILDVGSSNGLTFELAALDAPQYNMHRFGIYFTDSPRHADVLLILGRPTKKMLEPLNETITQLPAPFYIVTIDDCPEESWSEPYPTLPNHVVQLEGIPSASEIFGVLMQITKRYRS